MNPPATLLQAFRATEMIEAIAVLMADEGFDAESMRVLAAWQNVPQTWATPKKPLPDDGRPTTAAWRWLVSGWEVDIEELARGAGVTRQVAKQKLALLQTARLIYPDGSMAKAATNAIRSHVASRLIGRGKKSKKSDDDGAN